MDNLFRFSANSANDENNKHLWLLGASQFIPQINSLLEETNYKFKIIDIIEFENQNQSNLEYIFNKNLSDKAYSHNYYILYSYILNKLKKDINILEVGLGTNNPNLVSTMGENGRPGASLYAFNEYLPDAHIYGCDIDKDILFNTDKIKTCFVDQLDYNSFNNIHNSFGNIKYDLFIDDGLHSIGANFNTLLFALKNLNENGWIVIEDIGIIDNWKSIDYILTTSLKYKTYLVNAKHGYLYVINKL